MNTLSKLTLISVMISAMAGCSVRKDGNNLSNVTTADSLLFTEPLDTLPDGVISSVSWLPLQNSDQRIIDEISKLSVVDSFIVIGSRRQAVLQVYSTEGKFLYEISEKGQGPEEYLEIATFTVTPTSIYILDNFSHKISRYALEKGTFMGKTEVPFVAWDMEAFDDNDFTVTRRLCRVAYGQSLANYRQISASGKRIYGTLWQVTVFYPVQTRHCFPFLSI